MDESRLSLAVIAAVAAIDAIESEPVVKHFSSIKLVLQKANPQKLDFDGKGLQHGKAGVLQIVNAMIMNFDDATSKQPEEKHSGGDVTSSSSSADDTVSLERNSSLGSDTPLPFPPAACFTQPKDRHSLDGSCTSMVAVEGGERELAGLGEKEEELDSTTDVPAPSSVSRSSMWPLSPFRCHSWGPGKNATNEAEINQRRYSICHLVNLESPPLKQSC
ncbi:hypothetical protein ASZ78_017039 [Callipepla squamata]|uniref:Uncharacterized protein n=1 Tax=Callipepla squamata TaxID=9009 RepID=A0A226MD73_CALSU|nr:hypothetical protein ASZ78_017039 [Callipepla squamata]